jgi:hypothetical protein
MVDGQAAEWVAWRVLQLADLKADPRAESWGYLMAAMSVLETAGSTVVGMA